MDEDVTWLTAAEEQLWRSWVAVNTEMSAALERDLQREAGVSMPDYGVLVHLTDDPDGRVRVSDLARSLQWEKSRLSHHVTRMERRGLVERTECPEDGRGAFVAVTPAGREASRQAAPGHVAAVRRLFLDHLEPDEVEVLTSALARVHAGLTDEG